MIHYAEPAALFSRHESVLSVTANQRQTAMDESNGSITMFLHQMMAGDEAAVSTLWQRFLPRLLGLARKTLANRHQRMADVDDAVQSAFASFWKRAADGEFGDQLDRHNMWNLLGVITVRKSLRQLRHERAEKRGGGRVLTEGSLDRPNGTHGSLDDIAGSYSPTDLDVNSTELLQSLTDDLREIAVLRLLGYRNSEIAVQLNCSERTIDRKLDQIRGQWETAFVD